MTLNVPELQAKADSLRREATVYVTSVQAEINQLQQALQAKVREAQKIIDQKEGQINGLEELIKEMGGTVPTVVPAPENT